MELANKDRLMLRFGTATPIWELKENSNAIKIRAEVGGSVLSAVMLNKEQLATIRSFTGIMQNVDMTLQIDDEDMNIVLIGKKSDIGTWSGVLAYYDNTKAVAGQLTNGLSFAEQLLSEVNSTVVVINQEGKIVRWNKLAEEVTGMSEEKLIGYNIYDLLLDKENSEESKSNVSGFFQNKSSYEVFRQVKLLKGIRTLHLRNKFVTDWKSGETFLICSGVDVTEELEAKKKLEMLATTDELTTLANRHKIMSIVAEKVADNENFSVLFMDLDNFKKINDCYGHGYGDELLKHVASVLQKCLPVNSKARLGRLGGDEFLITMEPSFVETYITDVQYFLSKVIKIGFAEIFTSCSIGIAQFPKDASETESLIRYADTAMYVAKEQGKKTHVYFEQEMNKKVEDYLWLDQNLRVAIEKEQLEVYYQPKINIADDSLSGMEALIRWKHSDKGFISPLSFIPFAEESGMIDQISAFVLKKSAQLTKTLLEQGVHAGKVAVNLSPRQFKNKDILSVYDDVHIQMNIPMGSIDCEITESCFIDNQEQAIEIITALREKGAFIYMDDFGTGFSSLSQLVNLPIDVIKMDRSFIKNVSTVPGKSDDKSKTLVKAIAAVAKQFGMKVVAEGVESIDQLDFLRKIKVDTVQGYLYAKPMPEHELIAWIEARKQKVA